MNQVLEHAKAGVNQTRLLQQVRHLFANSLSVLGELMQNARRAGGTSVAFVLDNKTRSLTVADDGCGIQDFSALVTLCSSEWKEDVALSEKPFGMGLYAAFAAGSAVTFRSRGRIMRVSPDDVENRRTIAVVSDPDGPAKGTSVCIEGLREEFLRPCHHPFGEVRPGLQLDIEARAMGFPIPVTFNGAECPRPHAQSVLPGEITEVGYVSISGLHRQAAHMEMHERAVMYLQGLPIGNSSHRSGSAPIVHLDSLTHQARMPDRSHLFNEDEAVRRVGKSLLAAGQRFLRAEKRRMTPEQFAQAHWQNCDFARCPELMNDVPFMPAWCFSRQELVSLGDHSNHQLHPANLDLVSRQDLLEGKVKAWRRTPDSPCESAAAAPLMKVMQREDIYGVVNVHPGHWIHGVVPDASEFKLTITPVNSRGSENYPGALDWLANVSLQLVDAVEVEITSRVDDSFSHRTRIEQDWVLHAACLDEAAWAGDCTEDAVCYLMANDNSPDHPVDALSDYCMDDSYQDEWRSNAYALWESLAAGLLQLPIAITVQGALRESPCRPTAGQREDIAIVRVVLSENVHGELHPRFGVVDPNVGDFWERAAAAFAEADPAVEVAQRLRSAVAAAVQPGQVHPCLNRAKVEVASAASSGSA